MLILTSYVFTLSELLKKCQSEFEVSPEEEDDGYTEGTSAESCFDFDDLAKVANLDLIDVGQDQGEDDGSPFDRYRRKMEDLREDGKLKKYVGIHLLLYTKGCNLFCAQKFFKD